MTMSKTRTSTGVGKLAMIMTTVAVREGSKGVFGLSEKYENLPSL